MNINEIQTARRDVGEFEIKSLYFESFTFACYALVVGRGTTPPSPIMSLIFCLVAWESSQGETAEAGFVILNSRILMPCSINHSAVRHHRER